MNRLRWIPFLLAVAANLIGIAVGQTTVSSVAQVLLMPTLLLAARNIGRLGVAALLLAWLGDTVPRFLSGDPGLLALIGFFLASQVLWLLALWRYRHDGLWPRTWGQLWAEPHRWWTLAYVLYPLVMVAVVVPRAGWLGTAVVAYALAVVLMAYVATGLGLWGTVAGISYVVSDSLLALRLFGFWPTTPTVSFAVMATYTLAQGLLVLSLGRKRRASVSESLRAS
ncbi:lysoplasmalogenase family protein [Granulicoccus phenolivorans]|uniref:lysoplasmalogenase family protein n=1 Tax=Granulicoccus phenolivorans TaxID=266854 RepID=UPI00040CAB26|nr:lysoplasmalogenase family protein [Granulicoccus phenolivorans]